MDFGNNFRPLCPELYQALRQRFPRVTPANEGVPMLAATLPDPVSGRPRSVIEVAGEYYRVDCPHCQDTKQRLWINHRYGNYDGSSGFHITWLAWCFNEPCLESPGRRNELERMIFGFRNFNQQRQMQVLQGDYEKAARLSVVSPPGQVVSLAALPLTHPANQFLISRRYDPYFLAQHYGLGYCITAAGEYRPAQSRIVIPIWMHGQFVGWQGRYVGDLNWKVAETPKYYGCPNMGKSRMLYGYDEAKQWPFAVVVEGAPGRWRVGGPSMAALGKTLTHHQRLLLEETWPGKPVILALDPDARESTEGIVRDMQRSGRINLIPLWLNGAMDPGDYTHEAIVNIIRATAARHGVDLPEW